MILSLDYQTLNSILLIVLALFVLYLIHIVILTIYIDHKYFDKRFTGVEYIRCYKKEDYHSLNCDDFSFVSNNNKLNGNMFYVNKQLDNIAIFACGFKMTYQRYMPEINYLCSLGYTVFTYDNTGTGQSEGKSLNGAPQAIMDLEKCIDVIKEKYPNAKITLVGHSMGGYAVVNVLNLQKVDKVLAISPFNNIIDVVMDNANKIFHNKLLFFKASYKLYYKLKFKKYASFSTYKTLKYVNIPVLVIHGTNDKTVLIDNFANSMMTNQNAFVNYLVVENKKHNPLLSYDAINYNLYLAHQIDDLKYKYRKKAIPEIELQKINENVDDKLRSEFDQNVINKITNFLK